ncbi:MULTISPECIES: hypothetical protein [Roseateles]|uniref:Uncharacterized protein n=1 Tax=Pelomonas caseinilytica TaxID=2906763 RepID=A0ABS8XGP6_9BURK|nr:MULTISPECIES: hypothetical protein [unclassified Roseateles]MCE4538702.1 hypothetical protein [Pelomonas sp. P7]HEV6967227.1 hypothetical protein [Roseateles sp.]
MTSAVLKWIANGLIGLVVAGTLWMAQAVQTGDHGAASLMLAQVSAPDAAASAPAAPVAR